MVELQNSWRVLQLLFLTHFNSEAVNCGIRDILKKNLAYFAETLTRYDNGVISNFKTRRSIPIKAFKNFSI